MGREEPVAQEVRHKFQILPHSTIQQPQSPLVMPSSSTGKASLHFKKQNTMIRKGCKDKPAFISIQQITVVCTSISQDRNTPKGRKNGKPLLMGMFRSPGIDCLFKSYFSITLTKLYWGIYLLNGSYGWENMNASSHIKQRYCRGKAKKKKRKERESSTMELVLKQLNTLQWEKRSNSMSKKHEEIKKKGKGGNSMRYKS